MSGTDATRRHGGPLYRFKRWMYPNDRPNRLARLLNHMARLQFSYGVLAPRVGATLEVPGRRSGRMTAVPLVVADYQGLRYLVSMLGQDANWVGNVRAAGGRAVLWQRGRREAVKLDEVDADQRAPIIRRYLNIAPGARPHIPADRHAPVEEFERIAARFPVFRIATNPGGVGAPDPNRRGPGRV